MNATRERDPRPPAPPTPATAEVLEHLGGWPACLEAEAHELEERDRLAGESTRTPTEPETARPQ